MMVNQVAATVASQVAKVSTTPSGSTFGQMVQRVTEKSQPVSVAKASVAKVQGQAQVETSLKIRGAGAPSQILLDRVAQAQKQMDKVLAMAQSGKTFTPAQLLSLQAQVYQSSQELDLAGKVVEKVTGGVKQILQTQL